MRRYCSASRREFEPVIRLASASKIKCGAPFGRLGQVTSAQFCFNVGEQRFYIDVELPRNVLGSRSKVAKSRIVFVKELMIEAFAHDFTGALFNFADVNQHPCRWIHRTGEDKIGDVIAATAIARV